MTKKIKVFTSHDDYGAMKMALENLNINYEIVGASIDLEQNKNLYRHLHGKRSRIYDDIQRRQEKEIPYHHLLFYRWYQEDITAMNKRRNVDKNVLRGSQHWRKTALFNGYNRLVSSRKPYFLIMETINTMKIRYNYVLQSWLDNLEELGYKNYQIQLNAKDFGVPHNRSRLFVISVLHGIFDFETPQPQKIQWCIEDILDKDVDEKYFISNTYFTTFKHKIETEYVDTSWQLLQYRGRKRSLHNPNIYRVYYSKGQSPSLMSPSGGGRRVYILEKPFTDNEGYVISHKNSKIRSLTIDECIRLMGINDKYGKKIKDFYKGSYVKTVTLLANGVVVNVLEAIISSLFNENNELYQEIIK